MSEKDLTFKKACDIALALELAQNDTKQLSTQAAIKDSNVHKVQYKTRGQRNIQRTRKFSV